MSRMKKGVGGRGGATAVCAARVLWLAQFAVHESVSKLIPLQVRDPCRSLLIP